MFSQEAMQTFNTTLFHINWSEVINCTYIITYIITYDLFYNKFKINFDNCFPSKIVEIYARYNGSPHNTPALRRSIKEKLRLEKLAYK